MINKQNLYSVLAENVLDAFDSAIVATIIQEQYHIIQELLPHYDWAKLENLPLSERPPALVKYLKDKVVYALLLCHSDTISEAVQVREQEATKFFEAIHQGTISPNWPRKQANERWGGNPRHATNF